jgi:hypothetical protein
MTGDHIRRICSYLLAIAVCISECGAADYTAIELADWNSSLSRENWRVLMAGREQQSLGLFLASPAATDVSDTEGSLAECGVSLIRVTRTRFTSPSVPAELVVASLDSQRLSPAIRNIMDASPSIKFARLRLLNPKWTRLLTSETTSLIYASAIWKDPTLRSKLIQCIQNKTRVPLIDSVLVSDLVISFHGHDGRVVDVDNLMKGPSASGILKGALISRSHHYSIAGATLARRYGICTNTAFYFRSAQGALGSENCSVPGLSQR